MEKNDLTRSYLETLSSNDLIALGDDYGIDIPENLSRRYVITEILDLVGEQVAPDTKGQETSTDTEILEIPFSYNENKIVAVLRNPAWCYVTWDFNKDELLEAMEDSSFENLVIRLLYYKSATTNDVSETFDIQINATEKEQFILLSSEYASFAVSLIVTFDDKAAKVLASSHRVDKPMLAVDISLSGLQKTFTPIQTLSGLPAILKTHYNEHRHSFVRV